MNDIKRIEQEAEERFPTPMSGTDYILQRVGYIAAATKYNKEIEGIKIKAKIEELEYQIEECEGVIAANEDGDELKYSLNDMIYDFNKRIENLKTENNL